jgi:putative salt-induced outer membrane protein YdiY
MRTPVPLALALLAAVTLGSGPARAQDAPAILTGNEYKAHLRNGDVLTGKLVTETADAIVLQHPELGLITISRTALAPPPAVVDVPVPIQTPPPGDWTGSFEIGTSGSNGNTVQNTFRTEFKAQKKTEQKVIDLGFVFRRTTQNHDTTEENGRAEARVTWPEPDSPWGTFVGVSVEKDQFKDYSERVRVSGGRTYDFIDRPEEWLQGRFGAAVRKDIGAEEDDIELEGVLAADYWYKFSETSKFSASTEIYPVITGLGEFTSITKAAWESKLADESPWVVKLGVEHRYDSDVEDDERSTDWAYFASLGYTF